MSKIVAKSSRIIRKTISRIYDKQPENNAKAWARTFVGLHVESSILEVVNFANESDGFANELK